MSPMVIWRPLNDGTLVPGGSSLAMGSIECNFAARDEFGEQCGRHRLGDGADFERRVLIVGALRFRIRAEIGACGGAAVDHRCRNASAGAIVLEALLECRAQIAIAHGRGRHCRKHDGDKSEEMRSHGLSCPTSRTVERHARHATMFAVSGGNWHEDDRFAGVHRSTHESARGWLETGDKPRYDSPVSCLRAMEMSAGRPTCPSASSAPRPSTASPPAR